MIRVLRLESLLVLSIASCAEPAEPFRVISIAPDPDSKSIRLNEPIVIRFSRSVDPSSVSESSIAFVRPDGARARGAFRVDGETLVFLPDPPSDPSFSDAGLLPGAAHELILSGFPARDGVLATDGDPLETGIRVTYHTLAPEPGSAGLDAFVDPMPSSAPALTNGPLLRSTIDRVAPDGVVRLEFSEPLSPRSVSVDAFDLRFDNAERERVPFVVALEQDRHAYAVIVRPEGGFRIGTSYLLLVKPPMKLCDLVGNAVDEIAPIPFRCDAGGRLEFGRSRSESP